MEENKPGCKCHTKQHAKKAKMISAHEMSHTGPAKKMNLYASFVKAHYDKSKSFMENSKALSAQYRALKEKARKEMWVSNTCLGIRSEK